MKLQRHQIKCKQSFVYRGRSGCTVRIETNCLNFCIKVSLCIQKANQKIGHAWSIYSWSRTSTHMATWFQRRDSNALVTHDALGLLRQPLDLVHSGLRYPIRRREGTVWANRLAPVWQDVLPLWWNFKRVWQFLEGLSSIRQNFESSANIFVKII